MPSFRLFHIVSLFFALLAACGVSDSESDGADAQTRFPGRDAGATSGVDTAPSQAPDLGPPVEIGDCEAVDLGTDLPANTSGSTAGGQDQFIDSGCDGRSGQTPDATFVWRAPATGQYTFSTAGSDFDTILYVLKSTCDGEELACNDDARSDLTSGVRLDLAAGQQVLVVVDGFDGETGDFDLSISGEELICDNGLDDDNDGVSDCSDSDCASEACANGGDWPEAWARFEEEMLDEVNRHRAAGARCGDTQYGSTVALEMDERVRFAARGHSQDMAENNFFQHRGSDGREFEDRMADAGFTGASPWGENIQTGSPTPQEATTRLMNSVPHCHNIMNPSYRVIGVGYAYSESAESFHYWTQDFGGSH